MTDRLVVVPLDLSEFSVKALEAAISIVDDVANIRILHVIPPADRASPDEKQREEQAREALNAFLHKEGYPTLHITVLAGDPVKHIIQFAEDCAAGLIVIPSHGRGMLTEMLLGSTTYSVVRRATLPVLVLKPKTTEHKNHTP